MATKEIDALTDAIDLFCKNTVAELRKIAMKIGITVHASTKTNWQVVGYITKIDKETLSYAEKTEDELGKLFINLISFINNEVLETMLQLDEKENEEEQVQTQRSHAERVINRWTQMKQLLMSLI